MMIRQLQRPFQITSNRLFLSVFLSISLSNAQAKNPEQLPEMPEVVTGTTEEVQREKNIFSDTRDDQEEVPTYATANNALASESVPNWDQIRLIPSLTGPQQKQIRSVYDQLKQDLNAMQLDLANVNQQIHDLKSAKPATSISNTTSGAITPQPSSASSLKGKEVAASQIKPWQRLPATLNFDIPPNKRYSLGDLDDLKKQAIDLNNQIKAKHQAAWDQISQTILRPDQVDTLDRIRNGEIVEGKN